MKPSFSIRRIVRLRVVPAVVLCSMALAGCATGPDAHPRDPMEPWNRGVYRFNDAVDRALTKPVATAYTKVTPEFARKGVRNFFSNLGDAWSTVNSILQFKGEDAANSFFRVVVNTVFGMGGVFDVATEARIPKSKQDFGLTLGRWGVPTGPYMVLPFLGPSTVRDAVALPVDLRGNAIGAIDDVPVRNVLSGLSVVSNRSELLEATELLEEAALDPYLMARDAYLQLRDVRSGQEARGSETPSSAGGDGYEPPLTEEGETVDPAALPQPAPEKLQPGAEGSERPLEDEKALPAESVAPAAAASAPAASSVSVVEEPTPVAAETPQLTAAAPSVAE